MDSVETDRTIRAVSRIGAILPAHCTAVGKAQLAQMLPADIERLYGDQTLTALTGKSITTLEGLRAELEKIARKGYADENEEADVRSAAVAAIGIVAPASRLTDEKIGKEGVSSLILESGRVFSSHLGFISQQGNK